MFDLTPAEWQELHQKIDFTDEEQNIIQLRRRGWKWSSIAAELYMSERQIYRIQNRIMKKIKRTSWQ